MSVVAEHRGKTVQSISSMSSMASDSWLRYMDHVCAKCTSVVSTSPKTAKEYQVGHFGQIRGASLEALRGPSIMLLPNHHANTPPFSAMRASIQRDRHVIRPSSPSPGPKFRRHSGSPHHRPMERHDRPHGTDRLAHPTSQWTGYRRVAHYPSTSFRGVLAGSKGVGVFEWVGCVCCGPAREGGEGGTVVVLP